jgi:hypothetical protein
MLSEDTTQGIWVGLSDGAEIIGMSKDDLQRLAQTQLSLEETEREIRVRQRDERYEFWLPDLVRYART